MTMEHNPVWDQAALLGRVRGKTDRVVKLLNLYLEDMPDRLALLNQQADPVDLDEISATAHTIKGVSGNLGFMRLQFKAAELEQAAKDADTAKTTSLVEDIVSEYDKSEAELKAFLAAL